MAAVGGVGNSTSDVLDSLVVGEPCAVTTCDSQVVTGTFRGIDVAHGDRPILVRSPDRTYSIQIESVLSIQIESVLSSSGPSRRAE